MQAWELLRNQLRREDGEQSGGLREVIKQHQKFVGMSGKKKKSLPMMIKTNRAVSLRTECHRERRKDGVSTLGEPPRGVNIYCIPPNAQLIQLWRVITGISQAWGGLRKSEMKAGLLVRWVGTESALRLAAEIYGSRRTVPFTMEGGNIAPGRGHFVFLTALCPCVNQREENYRLPRLRVQLQREAMFW